MRLRQGFALFACALLPACATGTEGTVQTIQVTTTPEPGAKCEVLGTGLKWRITTPMNIDVPRANVELKVTCSLKGYHDARAAIVPVFTGAQGQDFLGGGFAQLAVTRPAGADYSYPPSTEVLLTPVELPDEGQPHDSTAEALPNQPFNYPQVARRNRWEGTVVLNVYVDEKGNPIRADKEHSSGYDTLDNAALESVMAWKFEPAWQHGARVRGWTRAEIVYRMEDVPLE